MKNIVKIVAAVTLLTSCSTSKYYFNKRLNNSSDASITKMVAQEKNTTTVGTQNKIPAEINQPAEDTVTFPVKTSVIVPVVKTEILTGYSVATTNKKPDLFFKQLMQKIKAPFTSKRAGKQKMVGNSQDAGGVIGFLLVLGVIALIVFVNPFVGIGVGIALLIIIALLAAVALLAGLIWIIMGGFVTALMH